MGKRSYYEKAIITRHTTLTSMLYVGAYRLQFGNCKNGHTPAKLEAIAPTCTEDGLTEGSYCSVCQAVITPQTKIDAVGHDKSDWISDNGARYKECNTCHVILEVDNSASINHEHSFGEWISIKSSTCTTEGQTKRTCALADCGMLEINSIPKLAHEKEWTVDLPASCASNGSRHEFCKICNTIFKSESLPKLSHQSGA